MREREIAERKELGERDREGGGKSETEQTEGGREAEKEAETGRRACHDVFLLEVVVSEAFAGDSSWE